MNAEAQSVGITDTVTNSRSGTWGTQGTAKTLIYEGRNFRNTWKNSVGLGRKLLIS